MSKMGRLFMTYQEKAEEAVEIYYKQHKVEPLQAICHRINVPYHLAHSVLCEFNE